MLAMALVLSAVSFDPVARLPLRIELAGDGGAVEAPTRKRALLIFLDSQCPVSNGYSPEFARIAKTASKAGLAVLGVHSDPSLTPAKAEEHAREHGLGFAVAVDAHQALARAAGVRLVPQAVLSDASGRVVYRGRIDDLRTPEGIRRPAATRHDLRDALAAFIEGRPVPAPGGEPFGCPLPQPLDSLGKE